MSLKTLLFVSESLLGGDAEAEQLAAIVKSSQDRNLRLGVSAALVATRGQFAQLLEGPAEGLRSLMASIKRDPRHRIYGSSLNRIRGRRSSPHRRWSSSTGGIPFTSPARSSPCW